MWMHSRFVLPILCLSVGFLHYSHTQKTTQCKRCKDLMLRAQVLFSLFLISQKSFTTCSLFTLGWCTVFFVIYICLFVLYFVLFFYLSHSICEIRQCDEFVAQRRYNAFYSELFRSNCSWMEALTLTKREFGEAQIMTQSTTISSILSPKKIIMNKKNYRTFRKYFIEILETFLEFFRRKHLVSKKKFVTFEFKLCNFQIFLNIFVDFR